MPLYNIILPIVSVGRTAFIWVFLATVFCSGAFSGPKAVAASQVDARDVMVLCYHNITRDEKVREKDVITITQRELRSHFEYLKQNGFHPISFQAYLDYYQAGKPLPDKPVLLTFDDGYRSHYDILFPLVVEYRYPVLVSIVTEWMDTGFPQPGISLLSWPQVKEMEASGLVEFASHTHSLHRWGRANSFGDTHPVTSSLMWLNGRYENVAEYKNRIEQDLLKSQQIFRQQLGHKAKALVWPYGEYTVAAVDAARTAGFVATFSLSYEGEGKQNLLAGKRAMIAGPVGPWLLGEILANGGEKNEPLNLAQLDLDSIVDVNSPQQTEKNIESAILQAKAIGANAVALQVFVDTDGSGNVRQVYFQNSQMPVKIDVLGHVANRFQQAGIFPIAWAPSLAMPELFGADEKVTAAPAEKKGWYDRATPFSPSVEKKLSVFYEELAMAAPSLRGVLIQDDLYLNDFEDFSRPARLLWRKEKGTELTPEFVRVEKNRRRWTEWKTDHLDRLSELMVASFRRWRPKAVSARNIYAAPAVQPESQDWFAQKLSNYLQRYDYTIVMAYPYMEKQGDRAVAWVTDLARNSLKTSGASEKMVFKLQSFDWAGQKKITARHLAEQFLALKAAGAKNLGLYPLDPYNADPEPLFPQ